jgi:DNA-directed RNA polymerase specialized sigma24 family protein
MGSDGSVSLWLDRVKAGDADAARRLWDRYFHRLVALAHAKLKNTPLRSASEEDVALSAMASFFRGVEADKFPDLSDRENLWSLLALITIRKSAHHLRRQNQLKRGGRGQADDAAPADLDHAKSREPAPDLAAQMAEQYRRLLDRLEDPGLEAVAVAKMEGYTNAEIAAQLGCATRSVERKIRLIRDLWLEDNKDE